MLGHLVKVCEECQIENFSAPPRINQKYVRLAKVVLFLPMQIATFNSRSSIEPRHVLILFDPQVVIAALTCPIESKGSISTNLEPSSLETVTSGNICSGLIFFSQWDILFLHSFYLSPEFYLFIFFVFCYSLFTFIDSFSLLCLFLVKDIFNVNGSSSIFLLASN